MKLPESIRNEFRRQGARGGHARAGRLSPARRTAIARKGAVRRWIGARFGKDRFAALGLPGGEVVDQGLDDLAEGKESLASLMVSLAGPRLRREGVPVPEKVHPDPEIRLFRLLEESNAGLAHARYIASLRQLSSFADACGQFRRKAKRRAK